jgi:hypothetical protein
LCVGSDCVAGIVTRYGLTVRESNPDEGEIFHIRRDRPWDPPSLLQNGYRVIPGVKRPGCGVEHTPHLAARLKKEKGQTSTSSLGLHGLFYGEINLLALPFVCVILDYTM